ncbi:MAG: sigma 54-interacting transcriptional regulator [Deltaproteobacteria bacterium]|nr:sigma 54-interacting transcriptional regulator [Deltaproteobacteria bacterium]
MSEVPEGRAGWAAIETAFAALGRVLLLLDGEFRVLRATCTLDAWVCPGACQKIPGRPIEDLLGARLFGVDESLRASLENGGREEGRRAFVQCETGAARLASVTAAPVPADAGAWAEGAKYLVVLRPAEDDELILEGALAAQGLVARAPAMLKIVRFIETLHRSDATVLITGESGTGKEVIARAIHASSARRSGPFVAVNCGALPADLLESELFGHVRGAFTGAVRDRVGRFEAAKGGVVFLDEIGDMPIALQVKLLRVLQARTFERVGESTTRTVDARVIAATNVDLKEAIAAGRFREDLYYRLRVVPIHVPPLRGRAEDIEALARHLLARIAAREGRAVRLSPDVLVALKSYAWPGNVRELENAIEYAVAICQRQTVQLEDLPPEIAVALDDETDEKERPARAEETVGSDEAARVRAALDAHRWHHARAAAELGISRTTLWRKMRALGLT